MQTQQVYKQLAEWLRENTADLAFKRASIYEEAQAAEYQYKLVAPAVYELMLPLDAAEHEKDKAEAPITAPSIIITNGGEITQSTKTGRVEMPILLHVAVWNPGKHTVDENGDPAFAVDGEGWRDCVHLMDAIKTRLANSELPAGCEMTGDIIASPPANDDPHYPYYFATVQFTIAHFHRLRENKYNI